LTEAGYVGEDVENIIQALYQASNNNLERTQRGIVYVDEIDKLAKKNFASSVSRDVSGEGVQQALLKLLEGTQANIQVRGSKRLPNQEYMQVDTTNILFIVGGSFEGLSKIVESRVGRRSVGFLAGGHQQKDPDRSSLHDVAIEDLEKFGLIPEFIGRLPVLAVMDALGADDMVRILAEPKNSLIKQYQKLFRFEKVKLTFTDEAMRAVAERAVARKAGARSLRSILEAVMLEVMYEMPSHENLEEVIVEEDVITEGAEPRYVPIHDYKVPV
jgi:ATP-dependent Clp protease ATP-binding subunit ClpX